MPRLLLAIAALVGLSTLTAFGASAAPSAAGFHAMSQSPGVTHVDYYWHHRHYRHRRFDHGRWHYWD